MELTALPAIFLRATDPGQRLLEIISVNIPNRKYP